MKALVYTGEKNLIYQDCSDPIKNKDEEIINKVNELGMFMIITNRRHFNH